MSKIEENAISMLEEHHLKKTPARLFVLKHMMSNSSAVTHHQLELALKHIADRVTIYRLLKSFEDKGILHKTFDHTGSAKYALCANSCDEHQHYDKHVHFNCTSCNNTYCLDDLTFPKLRLPKGYTAMQYDYTISGICKTCQ